MELSMRHVKALVNPEIAPLRLAGALIGLFAGTRDRAIFDFASRRAEHKLDVSAVLAGMADDARTRGLRRAFCRDDVRKFLVFIAQRAAFQLPMLRRTLHPLRKMAPVTYGTHGTCEMMRTRSKNGGCILKHRRSRRIDGGKTTARSR